MINKVGIVTLGNTGNMRSIYNAISATGAIPEFVVDAKNLENVSHIILPGVGSFPDFMGHLEPHLEELLKWIHLRPTLGICLGMQVMAKLGFEYGTTEGLGLVNGEVKKMEVNAPTPHMGWNQLIRLKDSKLLKGIDEDSSFYFMHSYEMINYVDVVTLTEYCKHTFVSMVEREQIFGVQFHPENSRESGIKLFKNFLEIR